MLADTRADVHSSPESLILIGVVAIMVGAAVARWWRPILRHMRRGYPEHSARLRWLWGTADAPRAWFIFLWAALAAAIGFGFLITGLSRL